MKYALLMTQSSFKMVSKPTDILIMQVPIYYCEMFLEI